MVSADPAPGIAHRPFIRSPCQQIDGHSLQAHPSYSPVPLESLSFGAPAKQGVNHCIPFRDLSLPSFHRMPFDTLSRFRTGKGDPLPRCRSVCDNQG